MTSSDTPKKPKKPSKKASAAAVDPKLQSLLDKIVKLKSKTFGADEATKELLESAAKSMATTPADVFWTLVRDGDLAIESLPFLIELAWTLREGARSEDVVLLLTRRGAKADRSVRFLLSGWPIVWDALATLHYAKAPALFEAAQERFSSACARGFVAVRCRLGKIASAEVPQEIVDELATRFVAGNATDGEAVVVREGALVVVPLENLATHAAPLGDDRIGAHLEYLRSGIDEGRFRAAALTIALASDTSRIDVGAFHHLAGYATVEEFAVLLDKTARPANLRSSFDGDTVRDVLERVRCDDSAAVHLALGRARLSSARGSSIPVEEGTPDQVTEYLAMSAIARLAAADQPFPEEADLMFSLTSIAHVDGPKAHEAAEPVRTALRALGRERATAVLRRGLLGAWANTATAGFFLLDLFPDAHLLDESMAALASWNQSSYVAFGLALLARAAPRMVADAFEKHAEPTRARLAEAMLYAAARNVAEGAEVPTAFDRGIGYAGRIATTSIWVSRAWEEVMVALPSERQTSVLRVALDPKEPGWEAVLADLFTRITSKPWPVVLGARIAAAAVRNVATDAAREQLTSAIQRAIKTDRVGNLVGLAELFDVAPTEAQDRIVAFARSGSSQNNLSNELRAIVERFSGTPSRTVQPEESAFDAIVRLVATAPAGERQPIVVLEIENHPPPGLSFVGGVPPVPSERWPTYIEEAMDHLFTLGFDDLPELRASLGAPDEAVAVSLFMARKNSAVKPRNEETSLVVVTRDDAARAASSTRSPPPTRAARAVRARRVDVPDQAFDPRQDAPYKEIRSRIAALEARALGEPLWLQDDPDPPGSFLLQAGEDFVGGNIGGGVLYVYDDGAFWQR